MVLAVQRSWHGARGARGIRVMNGIVSTIFDTLSLPLLHTYIMCVCACVPTCMSQLFDFMMNLCMLAIEIM